MRQYIPLDSTVGEGEGFIFTSKDLIKFENIILIVHGSGQVSADQC